LISLAPKHTREPDPNRLLTISEKRKAGGPSFPLQKQRSHETAPTKGRSILEKPQTVPQPTIPPQNGLRKRGSNEGVEPLWSRNDSGGTTIGGEKIGGERVTHTRESPRFAKSTYRFGTLSLHRGSNVGPLTGTPSPGSQDVLTRTRGKTRGEHSQGTELTKHEVPHLPQSSSHITGRNTIAVKINSKARKRKDHYKDEEPRRNQKTGRKLKTRFTLTIILHFQPSERPKASPSGLYTKETKSEVRKKHSKNRRGQTSGTIIEIINNTSLPGSPPGVVKERTVGTPSIRAKGWNNNVKKGNHSLATSEGKRIQGGDQKKMLFMRMSKVASSEENKKNWEMVRDLVQKGGTSPAVGWKKKGKWQKDPAKRGYPSDCLLRGLVIRHSQTQGRGKSS